MSPLDTYRASLACTIIRPCPRLTVVPFHPRENEIFEQQCARGRKSAVEIGGDQGLEIRTAANVVDWGTQERSLEQMLEHAARRFADDLRLGLLSAHGCYGAI